LDTVVPNMETLAINPGDVAKIEGDSFNELKQDKANADEVGEKLRDQNVNDVKEKLQGFAWQDYGKLGLGVVLDPGMLNTMSVIVKMVDEVALARWKANKEFQKSLELDLLESLSGGDAEVDVPISDTKIDPAEDFKFVGVFDINKDGSVITMVKDPRQLESVRNTILLTTPYDHMFDQTEIWLNTAQRFSLQEETVVDKQAPPEKKAYQAAIKYIKAVLNRKFNLEK